MILDDHSHDAKGRGKEASQKIDVYTDVHIFWPLFASHSYPFCGSDRLFFSTRLLHCCFYFCCISFPFAPALTCRIDGMPCTYKHWMKRPMCIRPLRRGKWVKIKPLMTLMTQSCIFFRSLFLSFRKGMFIGKESK